MKQILKIWCVIMVMPNMATAQTYTFKNNDFVNKLNEKVDSIAHKLFRLRKNKQIDVYTNDSLNVIMTDEEFEESVKDQIIQIRDSENPTCRFQDSVVKFRIINLVTHSKVYNSIFDIKQKRDIVAFSIYGEDMVFFYFKLEDLKTGLTKNEYKFLILISNFYNQPYFVENSKDTSNGYDYQILKLDSTNVVLEKKCKIVFEKVFYSTLETFYNKRLLDVKKMNFYIDSQCAFVASDSILNIHTMKFEDEYYTSYTNEYLPCNAYQVGFYNNGIKLYIPDYKELNKNFKTKILYIKQSEFIPLLPSWMQFLMKEVLIDADNRSSKKD